jgi:PAS domain S-box-containing protein
MRGGDVMTATAKNFTCEQIARVGIGRYNDALVEMPASGGGGCHTALLRIANFGRIAGVDPNQIASDLAAHVHGTRRVSAREITAAVEKAFDAPVIASAISTRTATPRPSIDGARLFDRIVQRGAAYDEAALWEVSPVRVDWPPEYDAVAILKLLYCPEDQLFLGTQHDAGPGVVRPVTEWIERFKKGLPVPEHVIPNPLTGAEGRTKDDKISYRADDCVAKFRFAVVEFDAIPRDEQIRFWAGATLPVVALIDSGGKSVHGDGTDFEIDYRLLLPDGAAKYIHVVGHPVVNGSGDVIELVGTAMDVTEQHEARAALETAFEQIKAEETELRRMTDAIASYIYVLRPDGTALYANQTVLDYTGLTLEDVQREDQRARVFHPEDLERLREERQEAFARGKPFETEQRALGKDGNYRWLLVRYNPLRDDHGNIIRWYATGTDIEDRKRAEESMRDENLALREQIDHAFMFEEIVGASPALQNVLSSIVKVAPTDSTVLITGETGTGKELIARAIHKHSQRSGHAFISVNCASIPSSLIASELFGHEKGAFTGAVQRRQGRFELAHSGTIFLDEVGDLPAETQIALLRVLQERQFERVGGNRIIPTDVRVIAATNRDLTAAIAAGTFRADLFYRLNVFPIEVPPLRKRKEDIPMLVEYFVKRYAEKAGKHISKIDNKTLELCQSYAWPGNIRELQNIVERSVILCSGDIFWIEKAWLASVQPPRQELAGPLPDTLQNQERKIIETALAESKGKVAGPEGAAAKLGIPRSTLDSKIKQLRIKKHRFIAE